MSVVSETFSKIDYFSCFQILLPRDFLLPGIQIGTCHHDLEPRDPLSPYFSRALSNKQVDPSNLTKLEKVRRAKLMIVICWTFLSYLGWNQQIWATILLELSLFLHYIDYVYMDGHRIEFCRQRRLWITNWHRQIW